MDAYNIAKEIVQKLSSKGHIAYFAGGCVRDQLMDHPSSDIDIATTATTDEVANLFEKTIPVGVNFGIIIVVEKGHHFEVATFRTESDYNDGRRPDKVHPASPEIDAKRRDFTINGMFFDPLTETLYDYVNGIEDIKKGVVRAIGDPSTRFKEDRLRMVRAVRYAARFRFAIDPSTVDALITHASDLYPAVAVERVMQELKKMADYPHFDEALLLLHRFSLLQEIFPSMSKVSYEELTEYVSLLPQLPPETPFILKLFEIFPFSTLEERLDIIDQYKLPNQDKKLTKEYELWRESKNNTPYEWAKLFSMPNRELFQKIAALHFADAHFTEKMETLYKKLQAHVERIKEKRPLITSQILKQHGIAPGKEMGKLLERAEQIAINEDLNSPDQVFKRLDLL